MFWKIFVFVKFFEQLWLGCGLNMKSKKTQEQERVIVDHYTSHENDRKRTMNHFVDQRLNRRRVQKMLKRWTKEGGGGSTTI